MQEQSKVEQAKVEEVGLTGGAAPQREHLTLDSARRVMLRPVRPDEDVDELFAAGHPPGVNLWELTPRGPYKDTTEFREYLTSLMGDETVGLTIINKTTGEKVGIINYLSIAPAHRRIEIGGLWCTPKYQRTYVNTEACYLAIKHAFEHLGYRRVEWKCDTKNEKSKAAAARLGFTFEGVFRKHMINKGINRDTAYFSITDDEWPAVKAKLETRIFSDVYPSSSSSA